VLAVFDTAGKEQHRLAVAGIANYLAARRLDEPIIIHQVLDLIWYELTSAHMQPAKIRLVDASLGDKWTKVTLHD